MGTEKSIGSEESSQFDDGLVFLDDLPPIENDSWKWLVLLVVASVLALVVMVIVNVMVVVMVLMVILISGMVVI